MVNISIDKENLFSFICNKNLNKKNKSIFKKIESALLDEDLILEYNFAKDAIAENDFLFSWFNELYYSVGVNDTDIFKVQEKRNKNDYISKEEYKAFKTVYLHDFNQETYTVLKLNNSLLVGRVGEEYEILNSLLEYKEHILKKVKNWKDICENPPLTDIIFCDEHYFSDKNTYKDNNNEYLIALCNGKKGPINIVIITKKVDISIDIDEELVKIKNNLSRKTKNGKINVTIITSEDAHSRHILTNYFRIEPTSCTNRKNNNLKNDVTVFEFSYINSDIYNNAMHFINEVFQKMIEESKFEEDIIIYDEVKKKERKKRKAKIYGDNPKSNFLKFS